jgi:GNAT superfamily N-acetyltransferase
VTGFQVSSATEADLPEISHVHVQGWRSAYSGVINQDYLDSLDIAEREKKWREMFDPHKMPLLIARDGQGVLAGFINFGKLQTPPPGMSPIRPLYSGEIYALYVLPEYWGKGLGSTLMLEAVQGLKEMRHRSMCLWVLEKNKRAISFYKKNKGERCGKQHITIGGDEVREVCFGWRNLDSFNASTR